MSMAFSFNDGEVPKKIILKIKINATLICDKWQKKSLCDENFSPKGIFSFIQEQNTIFHESTKILHPI